MKMCQCLKWNGADGAAAVVAAAAAATATAFCLVAVLLRTEKEGIPALDPFNE